MILTVFVTIILPTIYSNCMTTVLWTRVHISVVVLYINVIVECPY